MSKTKIESIYPLSFMQQILLAHNLYTTNDQGFLQLHCILNGKLDFPLFEQAWQETIQLHPALRTSVHWEDIEKPVQIIHPQSVMSCSHEDWRDLSEVDQDTKYKEYLKADKDRGLELSKAPVSRIILIKMSNTKHVLLWSCHHILLDGWSSAIILKDVFAYYDALCKGENYVPETTPSYRSYLGWLKRKDPAAAETFWKDSLNEYKRPSLVSSVVTSSNGNDAKFDNHVFLVSAEKTHQILAFLRQQRITLNNFMLAIWGTVLGSICGSDDVVFGTTVSGRSGAFPGIDRMAGLFMNVLPVRLKLNPEQRIGEWLKSIQTKQVNSSGFEFINLDQINSWTNWPGHLPLFDSLVVVENYPWSKLAGGDIFVEEFKGAITTTYPMNLIIKPGEQLGIVLRYDSRKIPNDLLPWFEEQLTSLFEALGDARIELVEDMLALIQESPIAPLNKSLKSHTNLYNYRVEDPDKVSNYVAPKNELELQLAKIWEEVFGRHPIGVHDNFFNLGGDSILIVQIISRARRAGLILAINILFEHQTIAELALFVQKADDLQPRAQIMKQPRD